MSHTEKAAYITGGFVLLAAIVTGLFNLSGSGGDITIKDSDCAQVNTGTSSGTIEQQCMEKKP